MKTSLRVERLYSLADYNNIKFSQEITEIPEHVLLNPRGIGLINSLIFLEMEKAHKNYIMLYKSYPASLDQIEQTASIIEEARTKTFKELIEELNKEQE